MNGDTCPHHTADIGSRGSTGLRQNDKLMVGPPWLGVPAQWPPEKSEIEGKLAKEIMSVSIDRKSDEIDLLITNNRFWKTVKISSWVQHFINNCLQKHQVTGPLSTDETEEQIKFLIRRAQKESESTKSFKNDYGRLNLQKDEDGIFRCHGRIRGDYPHLFAIQKPNI